VSEKGEVKGDYPREDAGQKQHSRPLGDGVRGSKGGRLRYGNGGRYDGSSDQGAVINREFQKFAGARADRQQAAETVGRSRVALISANRKSEGEKEDQADARIGRGPQDQPQVPRFGHRMRSFLVHAGRSADAFRDVRMVTPFRGGCGDTLWRWRRIVLINAGRLVVVAHRSQRLPKTADFRVKSKARECNGAMY
jgi:hypothetical protein